IPLPCTFTHTLSLHDALPIVARAFFGPARYRPRARGRALSGPRNPHGDWLRQGVARRSRFTEMEKGRSHLLGFITHGCFRAGVYWIAGHGIAAASVGSDHRMAIAEDKLVGSKI